MHDNSERQRRPYDAVLDGLRLRNSSYCQSLLRAPWGIRVPELSGTAYYVFVAAGTCVVRLSGDELELESGSFLFLPRGSAHELTDIDRSPVEPIDELDWERVLNRCIVRMGGDGPQTHVVTGSLDFEAHPLLTSLPEYLLLDVDSEDAWLGLTLETMANEATKPRPGMEVVLSRLAEVLAVGAIRGWLERDHSTRVGVLRGLQDEQIARALRAIHRDAQEHWTVESLATEAGMSRTAFAERFAELVAMPPITYWTQWRMLEAAKWMRDEDLTVEEAAIRLGYSSAAAFSRAFKSTLGETPGAVRRQERSTKLRTMNQLLAPDRQRTAAQ